MLSFRKFWEGIRIVAKAATSSTTKGDLEVLDPDSKIYYHNGTINSPLLTEAGTATIENKTIIVANNTITTAASGNLTATELNAALAELDSDVAIAAGDLAAHIADAVGAHAATAISFAPTGTLSSIEVQAALAELDGDIQAHITDAVGAHAASAISNIPSGNLAATEVQAALNELQSDIDTRSVQIAALDEGISLTSTMSSIDFVGANVTATNIGNAVTVTIAGGDVTGPASSTDNAITRFDGTTGKLIQNSTVTIDDAGAATGFTTIDASSTITGGNLTTVGTTSTGVFTASSTATVTGTFDANGLVQYASANDAATGANATLTTPTTKVIRLTNAGLISLDGIPGGVDARELIIENATGTTVVINEDTGGTAANRFYTGTTSGINLADKASLYLSYDATQSRWRVIGGSGSGTGHDSGCFGILDSSELLSTWSTGDNATFLGGGTLSGTFAKETTSPLNGTSSYKYTQAAGSLNDYLASPIQDVPIRFRGNTMTWTFAYTYNGGSSDIEPIVYDVTNSTKLTTSTNLLPSTGLNASIYTVNVSIPLNTTQIRVGFQTKIENSGKILQFVDSMNCSDSTIYANPSTVTEWQSYTPTFTGFGTPTGVAFRYRQVGSNIEINGKFTAGTATAVEAQVTLPAGFTSAGTTIIPSIQRAGASATSNTSDTNSAILIEPSKTYFVFGVNGGGLANTNKANGNTYGSSITQFLTATVPVAGLSASNPQIITASESFSTDTASLVYASSATYTPTTLVDAPVGTFITFTYASGGNVRTQTTTAPTQTTAHMNVNGIQVFTRVFGASSTAGNPAAVMIQVGKNFKGILPQIFKSTSKTTIGDLDFYVDGTSTIWGTQYKNYDPTTGIFYLDLGLSYGSAPTSRLIAFSDQTSQTNGYLVVNASKSPALVGVPQVQHRFATLSDYKAAATDGGSSSATTWNTRTLNTLVDSSGFVTSLSANQFVLPAGTYYIEGSAPAFLANTHQLRLRNITATSTAIVGSTEWTATSDSQQTRAFCKGEVIITAATTFELQHYTLSARATDGLGRANATNTGEQTNYAQLKITKVK